MKIAFLGTGMIVKDLMKTITKIPFEKKYILGTEQTREETERLAEDNHFDGTFYDYEELLQCDDIDTVYVALPNFLHYEYTKKALLAGKHAIIEKPITANYSELEELKKIAKEKHLMIFEAMSVVHMPAYQALKKDLDKLGEIGIVSLNICHYSSRYDAFKSGKILPVFDPHKAGGALMDLNVYNISFICGLFGEPKKVEYHANVKKGIDVSGILTLDYDTFKAVTIAAKDSNAPVYCSIQGDKACMFMNKSVNGMRKYSIVNNDGQSIEHSENDETHRLLYEFMDFITIVDNKQYERCEDMLEQSSIVSRTMEKARKTAGIVFDSDLKLSKE